MESGGEEEEEKTFVFFFVLSFFLSFFFCFSSYSPRWGSFEHSETSKAQERNNRYKMLMTRYIYMYPLFFVPFVSGISVRPFFLRSDGRSLSRSGKEYNITGSCGCVSRSGS